MLDLATNSIDSIDALAGLTNITEIDLSINEITDIGPLADNSGLGSGDHVILRFNPLSFESINSRIPELRGRGVTVDWIDDTIPPVAVANLNVTAVTDTSVTLTWTAPGGDGLFGTAYQYDLRYATDSATLVDWVSAAQVTGVEAPHLGGTPETTTVLGLDVDITYYFGLKTRDNSDNWSEPSNIAVATTFGDAVVTFADANLETVIREAIAKPTGDIHRSELFGLSELQAQSRGIADLTGLEYCINLHILGLKGNTISDVTPLADLSKLWQLTIEDNNVSDITPLAGLSSLRSLQISSNPISDISVLAELDNLNYLAMIGLGLTDIDTLSSLTNLEYLFLVANYIDDISVVSNFPKLRYAYFNANLIVDLTPLAQLDSLEVVALQYNQVVDISPLVGNSGIGSGDQVMLDSNPLSSESVNTHIPALQSRGVTVTY